MRPSVFSLATLLAVCAPLAPSALSQSAPLNSEIQISKLEATFVDSPKLTGGYSKKSSGRPGQWLELEVTFDRAADPKAPKFADDLTFNYYILLKNESVTEDRKPTLLTGSITHVHTPQDKGLHAVAFVSPRTLAKFFDGKVPVNAQQALTDYGVTISGKSGLLALAASKPAGVRGDKGWWDTPGLYSPAPGFILSKDQTPFAPLEWDYFEPVKSKPAN